MTTAPIRVNVSAYIEAQHVEIVDSWPLRTVFFEVEDVRWQYRLRRPQQVGSPARLRSFAIPGLFQVEKDSAWPKFAKTALRIKYLHFPCSPDMT